MEDAMEHELPDRIRKLPPFQGPFDAFRIGAAECEVLIASYPAGTEIDPHTHQTENCGVVTRGELILILDGRERRFAPGDWYHVPAGALHAARFDVPTSEIEFWFPSSGE
jgi:quercetin dioxygenase-like cupin family protein